MAAYKIVREGNAASGGRVRIRRVPIREDHDPRPEPDQAAPAPVVDPDDRSAHEDLPDIASGAVVQVTAYDTFAGRVRVLMINTTASTIELRRTIGAGRALRTGDISLDPGRQLTRWFKWEPGDVVRFEAL